MKIGIVGLGFVGGAMVRSFEEKGANVHAKYDKFRDDELNELGYRILRIKNEELQNMEVVLSKIEQLINKFPDIQ
jgi:very-short-patch-repair endonuclease